MKNFIKAGIFACLCLFAVSTAVVADNDKIITLQQLPQAAQTVIKSQFKGKKTILIKQETGLASRNYDVVFADGSKIEFDRNGRWTEVDCRQSVVPAYFIPQAIQQSVKQNYPGAQITSIEKDRSEYSVKLSNGIELTYNKKFKLIDVDN